jgi:hypothetical protein
MVKIQEYFGVGSVYFSGKTVQFKVFKIVDLLSIISKFNSYPVGGLKLYHYNLWVKIVNLISAKQHLTPDGLEKILFLKTKLNKWED